MRLHNVRADVLAADASRFDGFVKRFKRLTTCHKARDTIRHCDRNRPRSGFMAGVNFDNTAFGCHANRLTAFTIFGRQTFNDGFALTAILTLCKCGGWHRGNCGKCKGGKFELHLRPFRRQFAPLAASPDFQDFMDPR